MYIITPVRPFPPIQQLNHCSRVNTFTVLVQYQLGAKSTIWHHPWYSICSFDMNEKCQLRLMVLLCLVTWGKNVITVSPTLSCSLCKVTHAYAVFYWVLVKGHQLNTPWKAFVLHSVLPWHQDVKCVNDIINKNSLLSFIRIISRLLGRSMRLLRLIRVVNLIALMIICGQNRIGWGGRGRKFEQISVCKDEEGM